MHAVQDRVITKDKQLIGEVVTLEVNVEKVAQHKQVIASDDRED